MSITSPQHSIGPVLHIPPSTQFLLYFAFIIFLFRFADGLMTYAAPVYIDQIGLSPLIMGIILASSSLFGLATDLWLGHQMGQHRYSRYMWIAGIGTALFALILLVLPPFVAILLLSMAVWGVYYEYSLVAQFHFIHQKLPHRHHALAWGVLYIFISAAYMIAPVLASLLIRASIKEVFLYAVGIALIGLFNLGILVRFTDRRHKQTDLTNHHSLPLGMQFKIWKLLWNKSWRVQLFVFFTLLLHAFFYTSGAILSEGYKFNGIPDGALFIAFTLPFLFMGPFAGILAKPWGKKKAAYATGIFAGLFMALAGLAHSPWLTIVLVFSSAIFLAVAEPQINAVVEDFVDRLGHGSNVMIALNNSMNSFAYIIGPILAGLVAQYFSHNHSFTASGLLLACFSVVALATTPLKTRLPQKAIIQLEKALDQLTDKLK